MSLLHVTVLVTVLCATVSSADEWHGDTVSSRTASSYFDDDEQTNSSKKCTELFNYPSESRCSFIANTSSCQIDGGFINYLKLPYCEMHKHEALALVIILFWLVYLFFALSVVVDTCLCPCLEKITEVLHLNEDIAGVTFLALGNGAADIFSLLLLVLRGEDDDSTDEAGMGSILGGGMFVVSVSAGLIAFNYPITVDPFSLLRNILFYLAAVLWLTFMLWDNQIHLAESVGFIFLYVLYVFIVWWSHRRGKRKNKKSSDEGMASETTPLLRNRIHSLYGRRQSTQREAVTCLTPTPEEEEDEEDEEPCTDNTQTQSAPSDNPSTVAGRGLQEPVHDAQILVSSTLGELSLSLEDESKSPPSSIQPHDQPRSAPNGILPSSSVGVDESQDDAQSHKNPESLGPPEQGLLKTLWPDEIRRWKKHKWYEVCHAVVAYPITVAVAFTSPTVNPKKAHGGWNKHVTVAAVLLFPAFATLAFDAFFHEVHEDVFLGPIMAGVGILLALIVAMFTDTQHAPRGHAIFAFLGFTMSICWIYLLANEVVNIVVAFSVALKVTGALLGLILIAAGNSVCDLIANFFVARRGNPVMGFSASYGSPLLNMLIGIGMATTAAIIQKHGETGKYVYDLPFPTLLRVGSGFLCSSLALAAIIIGVSKWKAGKLLGSSLFRLYLLFLVAVFTIEFA